MDNQLPSALTRALVSRGHEALHVLDVGLDTASDSEIWDYAMANSLVLITKDQDFPQRALLRGAKV
ncbi:MAG TPA: DUF5615 family PIN-like protein [Terriglobia bacterium]|nr:DUF5615 family PIN-like protein [Terriglobia bacterium]